MVAVLPELQTSSCINQEIKSQQDLSVDVDPKPQIGIIVLMIISDRVQGVSPSELSGQGGHAHEPLVPAQVIRKAAQKQKLWP